MQLAKSIYSDEGLVLLAEGVELTEPLLNRLKELGMRFLYIRDPLTEGIDVREPISQETRRRAMHTLKRTFRDYIDRPARHAIGVYPYVGREMREVMRLIIDDLSSNRDAMMMLMDMQAVDHYLYSHSLNVCIYTTMLGLAHGYQGEDLLTLGLGALLHDIGKTQIDMQVLLKPGKLDERELAEMRRHAEIGYLLLKDEPNIPLIAAHCAYQHHERINGSGYPRGLQGDEIHEFAKWIAIVDSYDAMTSYRVYRNTMLPHQAVEALYAGSGTLYDTEMLKVFRDNVAIYPVGIGVRLSTGQEAVVVDLNATSVHRPIVRVLTDEEGHELTQPYDLDLSKQLSIVIREVLTESTVSRAGMLSSI
jgi:HD-GYP domain-containing protein (c-di-GMP phosphodiesterase class II)